jgi:hypothetical protein
LETANSKTITLTIERKQSPAYNSSYPKVAVQWLNQALCIYQSFCLVDSEVLRFPLPRKAQKRCATYKKPTAHLAHLFFSNR